MKREFLSGLIVASALSAALGTYAQSAAVENAVVRTVDKKGHYFSVWTQGGFQEFRLVPETSFLKKGAARPPTAADLHPGVVVTVTTPGTDEASAVELVADAPAPQAVHPAEAEFAGVVASTDGAMGSVSVADDWRDAAVDFVTDQDTRITAQGEPQVLLTLADLKKGLKVLVRAKDGRALSIMIQNDAPGKK